MADYSHLITDEHRNYSLPTLIQQYIHISKYSRYNDTLKRRETWFETVKRYIDFIAERAEELGSSFNDQEYVELLEAILTLKTMPSMRSLMTSGPAAKRDNAAMYNCSALAINHPKAFSEVLYLLSCGVGVGFSVERQEISELPPVPVSLKESDTVISVRDSKIGWAQGLHSVITMLYNGEVPKWDLSKIRPEGAKLKTFGGRSSGPKVYDDLLKFTVEIFKQAQGRKLTSIECHSLVCKIADAIVSGGVRRSATISLSNLSDDRMRTAKSGEWWIKNPHYRLANNSAVFSEKPEIGVFMREWLSLYESKSGERGIYNREGANKQVVSSGRRDSNFVWGTNPCGEVILRINRKDSNNNNFGGQFCNLSEVIARNEDSLESLVEKVKVACHFGVLQSSFTNFRYLRDGWKKNTEEDRLLGVSLTGIMDNKTLSGSEGSEKLESWLSALKRTAIDETKRLCDKYGLNMSAAITVVKPSGTVSQLTNTSSGIHARFHDHYIRAYRENNTSPVCQLLKDAGVPNEPDMMNPMHTNVFYLPVEAPKDSVLVKDINAIQQLEHWLSYKKFWCEHTASVTIYVQEHEWMEVGSWVYSHFDDVTGLSFLPADNGSYRQAPYTRCTPDEYEKALAKVPNVDWSALQLYEVEDMTDSAQTLACVGGACEL